MNDKINRLSQQLDLLYGQYQRCTSVKMAESIFSSLLNLSDLYYSLVGEDYLNISKIKKQNPYYFEKVIQISNHKNRFFLKNFLDNKKFHYQFMKDVFTAFVNASDENINGSRINDYDYYHDNKELLDILFEYYNDRNPKGGKILSQLLQDNRLFNVKNFEDFQFTNINGMTYWDDYNNTCFVIRNIERKNTTVYDLATIVHEIGHVEDFDRVGKSNFKNARNYMYFSILHEVNAIYREKEFIEFLIDNNIYKEEAQNNVINNCEGMLSSLKDFLLLTKLPNDLLQKNKYFNISQDQINKIFDNNLVTPEDYVMDIRNSLVYTYGEVLSDFLIENKDMYSVLFSDDRYMKLFDPKVIENMGVNSSMMEEAFQKKYEKCR